MAEHEQPKQLLNERSADFQSVYANNITVESSIWDVKLTFGEIDNGKVVQHTSVTFPWAMAKIMVYLLQTQIIGNEILNGKVLVNPSTIPPELPPPPDTFKGNAKVEEIRARVNQLRQQLIEESQL